MSAFNTAGLRLDQGPPLSIPFSFFLTGVGFLAAAGVVVFVSAGQGLGSVWAGLNAAVVHLGTVGLLLFTMLGALYQMLPVVAGAVVPWPRLAHGVHLLLVAGGASLIWGQATFRAELFLAATVLITLALLLFFVPAALALFRSEVRSAAVGGMRLAFVGLFAVALLGLRLAYARGGGGLGDQWVAWRFAHAHLGFIGWVGALISAISWQVVPMFYLAREVPAWVPRAVRLGIAATLGALLAVYAFGLPFGAVAFAALPGAAAVWLLHPVAIALSLRGRRRKRADASLWFWWLSMGAGPLCFGLGAATAVVDVPQVTLAYGFVALWGWAAALVHGMLTRILPFLVWFHLCAPRIGVVPGPVPSTRDLYPDRQVALGFWLHAATGAIGLAAIASGSAWMWRLLGVGIAATAGFLGTRLVIALVRAPR